jgi:hypothetical protein
VPSESNRSQLPPAITRYLEGPPPQSKEFSFLVGEWITKSRRHAPDGTTSPEIDGIWRAAYICGGRMLQDEYVLYLPDGREMASFVTLRTWCPDTQQWEMATLASHAPSGVTSFTGSLLGGEMHLQVAAFDPATRAPVMARVRFFNISDNHFEWEQLLSQDGGATWRRAVSIVATRKVEAQ